MPNWVTNKLTIIGDDKLVQKILTDVKSDEFEFDFNKIVPQPIELEGTTAPTRIISDTEYATNPDKGITQTMSDELIQKFGYDNWYDWRYAHWGTKWNADEIFISDNEVEFNTAWSNPLPIFVALSSKYADVEFDIMYADEDFGYNVGKYTLRGGEMYSMSIPEGGSKEAYQLALEVQGDSDYYTYDMLLEVDEDTELSNFYTTLVEISYETNKVVSDEMPLIILNEFLRLALEREDYEFATQVRDAIKSKELVGNSK